METIIKESLNKLDVKNDGHWTEDGEPRMDVMQELSNVPDLTRGQVTDIAPNFNRESWTKHLDKKEVEAQATEDAGQEESPPVETTPPEEVTPAPEVAPTVTKEAPAVTEEEAIADEPAVTEGVPEVTEEEAVTTEPAVTEEVAETELSDEENLAIIKNRIKIKMEMIAELKAEIESETIKMEAYAGEDRNNMSPRQQTIERMNHLKSLHKRKMDAHNKAMETPVIVNSNSKSPLDRKLAAENKASRRQRLNST